VNTKVIHNKAMYQVLRPDRATRPTHNVTPFEAPPDCWSRRTSPPRRNPVPGTRRSRLPQRRDAHPARRTQRRQTPQEGQTTNSRRTPTMPDPFRPHARRAGFVPAASRSPLPEGSSPGPPSAATGPGDGRVNGVSSVTRTGTTKATSDRSEPRSIDEDRRGQTCRGSEVTTPGHRERADAQKPGWRSSWWP
jgi:hypothetical protein